MWILPTLRNKRIIEARSDWSRQQVLAYQEEQFRELMHYLWANSPFYHGYYSDHGIRVQDLDQITVRDVPIVGKELLMDNFDRISNDPALRRDLLEAWIDSGGGMLYDKRFVVIHTSGSNGSLGLFVYDKHAWTRMRGVTTRANKLRINPFNRVRFAWYGASHGRFAGVTACRTLPALLCDRRICSVLDPLSKTIETLNQFQPEHLIGYAAAVHDLAEATLAGELKIRPIFVGTSGEILTDTAIAAIERAWGVSPVNAYGSSESLCLGLRMAGHDVITLMEDETIIEMLDDNDRGVAPGEVGRVVITALYNRAIPIVRYDIGDYVTRGHRAEGDAFDRILRIEGRVEEALPVTLTNGAADTIHPVVLSEFFVPGIRKFQFISDSRDKVILQYVADEDIDATVRSEFERILTLKGAKGATTCVVRRVSKLVANPSTGKRRLVVLGAGISGNGARPME